jgi:pyruvate formate lyase activating enzyme
MSIERDAFTVSTKYWHQLEDGRIQCDVCPRFCKLREGQRGMCFVRGRLDDEIVLTTYGRSSGYCVDPIEKKPLYHFLPGTPVLSFGTAGCNLGCRYCQNWDMSKSREIHTLADAASPATIAKVARELKCRSVAYTYNDPIIFLEYAMDAARSCKASDVMSVAVTNGYITPDAGRDFFTHMDAANVDLKAFTEEFYHSICAGHLEPVLETLKYIKHETDCWLEITTLLIPGLNDSDEELARMADWVVDNLGPSVPWHFSAFHPDYKMMNYASTPPATLRRARAIAMGKGVRYAYVGNVYDPEAESTYCHDCGATLIGRDGYTITSFGLDGEGACRKCGTVCAGKLEATPGDWGSRRMPVRIGDFEQPPGERLRHTHPR